MMLLKHELSSACPCRKLRDAMADVCMRAGAPRGVRRCLRPSVSQRVSLSSHFSQMGHRAGFWSQDVPGWVRVMPRACSFAVCQCQGPGAPSQAGPAATRQEAHFYSDPSFCHHLHLKCFVGVTDCCLSSGLHGLWLQCPPSACLCFRL